MYFVSRFGAAFVRRWIAGVSVDDVIRESAVINRAEEQVMINYLGEHFHDMSQVENAVNTYSELIDKMEKNKVHGCIALKATQLGMGIDDQRCYKNYIFIAKRAQKAGVFVWLDMEEHIYVSKTVSLYLKALRESKNIGICLQGKLKRSYADARKIVRMHGRIRLVKGAYDESARIMYTDRERVFENYLMIMRYLFEHSEEFIIATHDDRIIDSALRLNLIHRKKFAFAMLKGIRGKLAEKIAKQGNTIFIYVPFGPQWLAYSIRRLKEGSNIALVLRSVLQQ